MQLRFLSVLPRRMSDGTLIGRDAVLSIEWSPWKRVELDGARVSFRACEINLRWPVSLQIQLHTNEYAKGDYLCEHIDQIRKEERQVRFQIILVKAKQGGELKCEKFIYESPRIKIFEPTKWKHSVTKVEEGRRLLLNFGFRFAPHPLTPSPL